MIATTTRRNDGGISLAELNRTLKQKAIPLRDGRTVTLTVNLESGWIEVDVWDGDDSIELLSKRAPSAKAWAACRQATDREAAAFEATGGWEGHVAAWHREQAALKAA